MSRTADPRKGPRDPSGTIPAGGRRASSTIPPAQGAFATVYNAAAGPGHALLLPPVEADEIGRLGVYRVLGLLGEGGMGCVFHAEDMALRRPVALKVMKPELEQDPDGLERFFREARLMASIKHDHLVTVYQVGQEGRVPYLAMELLRGESLSQWMKQSRTAAVADVLRLGREIASGLDVIHRHGLIHRDVKPANVWLEAPGGRVKILDFGLARIAKDEAVLTQPGMVLGTPAYMAPEQARGEPADARSDLFSLGCILYELAAGARPFEGPTTMAVLTALVADDPKPLHALRPALPRDLSDLVMKLLAKNPRRRPASASEVVARLREIEARPAGGSGARPASATRREPPPRAGTRARPKKARPQTRRWLKPTLVVGLPLLAVVLAGSFAGLAWSLPHGAGRPNATPQNPSPPPPASSAFVSDWKPIDDKNPISSPPAPPGRRRRRPSPASASAASLRHTASSCTRPCSRTAARPAWPTSWAGNTAFSPPRHP